METICRKPEITKKCPFCAEEILAEAVKCRFCNEWLKAPDQPPVCSPADFAAPPKPKQKWYFATYAVVFAILCLGPLALPLVWINPRYKIIMKIVVTVIVIALTIGLYLLTMRMYLHLIDRINSLGL